MRSNVTLVVAVGTYGAIGLDGDLPWARQDVDMARFQRMTMGGAVIVGRKTRASMPELPGRQVVTVGSGEDMHRSVEAAICSVSFGKRVFLAGGVGVYRESADKGLHDCVAFTAVDYQGLSDTDLDFSVTPSTWRCVYREAPGFGVWVP